MVQKQNKGTTQESNNDYVSTKKLKTLKPILMKQNRFWNFIKKF